MLSPQKLKQFCQEREMSVAKLAGHLVRGSRDQKECVSALKNWMRGLFKPKPTKEDVLALAEALNVEAKELQDWQCRYKYAPLSARKARLVTELIVGRPVQDAMDLLSFTRRRAAPMVHKLIKCAVADADEQQADVDTLFVKEARVDDAGRRIGTKTWIAKDRGRAHPICKRACHIVVTVTQAD